MNILSNTQIEDIKVCGKILAITLSKVTSSVKPGISTYELDQIAEKGLLEQGARPSFKGYGVGKNTFPATLCTSINDEIVHGIPAKTRILNEGDIISIDIGAEFRGVYTDMAVTVGVGKISNTARKLIEVTRKSLKLGITQARDGNTIGDIGHAIQSYVETNGFNVIRDYVGHGIGTKPHLPPQIPNFGDAGEGIPLEQSMALAIEPMVVQGLYGTRTTSDHWTVKTADGSLAAHFEHTVIVTDNEPLVVTEI